MRPAQSEQKEWIHFFWAGKTPSVKNLFDWQHFLKKQDSHFNAKLWVDGSLFEILKENPELFKTAKTDRNIKLFSYIKPYIQDAPQFEAVLNGNKITVANFDVLVLSKAKKHWPKVSEIYELLHQNKLYPFSSDIARLMIMEKEPGFYCDFDTKPNHSAQFPQSMAELHEIVKPYCIDILAQHIKCTIIPSTLSMDDTVKLTVEDIVFKKKENNWFIHFSDQFNCNTIILCQFPPSETDLINARKDHAFLLQKADNLLLLYYLSDNGIEKITLPENNFSKLYAKSQTAKVINLTLFDSAQFVETLKSYVVLPEQHASHRISNQNEIAILDAIHPDSDTLSQDQIKKLVKIFIDHIPSLPMPVFMRQIAEAFYENSVMLTMDNFYCDLILYTIEHDQDLTLNLYHSAVKTYQNEMRFIQADIKINNPLYFFQERDRIEHDIKQCAQNDPELNSLIRIFQEINALLESYILNNSDALGPLNKIFETTKDFSDIPDNYTDGKEPKFKEIITILNTRFTNPVQDGIRIYSWKDPAEFKYRQEKVLANFIGQQRQTLIKKRESALSKTGLFSATEGQETKAQDECGACWCVIS